MNLFSLKTGAPHFVGGFGKGTIPKTDDIKSFLDTKKSGQVLREPTQDFCNYRDALLREADRSLFLSSSLVRWSHGLFCESASYWAQTTLYYGAFFAAKAILALLGGWDDGTKWRCEPTKDHAGQQEITLSKIKGPVGSHVRFWRLYYGSTAVLSSWFSTTLGQAFSPVNADDEWLIGRRNEFNYRTDRAFHHMDLFAQTFKPAAFPSCLSNELSVQLEVARSMVDVAFKIAKSVKLTTDVSADMKKKIATQVFGATAPDLSNHVNSLRQLILS